MLCDVDMLRESVARLSYVVDDMREHLAAFDGLYQEAAHICEVIVFAQNKISENSEKYLAQNKDAC